MQDNWWKFLRDYDPDIIKSTVPLGEELQKQIHIFLSPLIVETIDPHYQSVSLQDDPVSILPTKKNISRIARDIFNQESMFVIFKIAETVPVAIRNFLEINFGLIETGQIMSSSLKKGLEDVKTQIFEISDYESLNEALLKLGDYHNRVVFPAQICAIPNSFKDVEYHHYNERFAVVVGDGVEEMAYAWNRTLFIGNWMRTGITQIWLSKEIVMNEIVKPGLSKFINRFVGNTGNSSSQGAHFVSFSLEEPEIKVIADGFNKEFWHPKYFEKLVQHPSPNFGESGKRFFLKRGLEFYRAHSDEEHLVLAEPDVEQGVMGGQYWFIDLFIQFRPERFTNIIGQDYWWQLPQRNSLLRDAPFFNKAARINEHGMFSVLMSRRTDFRPDDCTLVVKLPDDRSIFGSLLCGESYDYYKGDDRGRFLSSPFYTSQRSDQGMYLSGVLSLFPDLLNAHHLFEEPYWRQVFKRMSNYSDSKDGEKKVATINKLKKAISQGKDFKNSQEDLEWLAERILIYARDYSKQEIDLTFQELVKEAKRENDAYCASNSGSQIAFKENEFRQTVSNLIDSKILFPGIKPKCPRCGYRIWYHLDNTSQEILCKGCGYNFSVKAEEKWYYRLNSLVRAAVSLHGTIPLLLVLGQLMSDARSSFISTPSLELINKIEGETDKYKSVAEIDLLCIKDGKFIIGEIKQSIGLFDEHEFSKMMELGKLLKPDIILFSSLDKKPNKFVEEKIAKLKIDLAYLEIDVQWYPLDSWIFGPCPVRE